MPTLPQLIEEDVRELDASLRELLMQGEAAAALVIDKGGFVIAHSGRGESFDTVTLAALAAGSFAATETMAGLVGDTSFSSVYQQGHLHSLLVMNVDEFCLLTVIFPASVSVGAVKYFALDTIKRIAAQLQRAQQRAPGGGFDLSMLNLADARPLFCKRTAGGVG